MLSRRHLNTRAAIFTDLAVDPARSERSCIVGSSALSERNPGASIVVSKTALLRTRVANVLVSIRETMAPCSGNGVPAASLHSEVPSVHYV